MQFGPGFLPTFLYYFTTAGVLVALVASRGMGFSLNSGMPGRLGLMGGVVAGLLGAYFNRTTTVDVQFQGQKKFLAELETTLAAMGYQLAAQEEDLRIYERSNLSKWLSGKLYVQLEQNHATIASRAGTLRRLRKQI
ncbi:hypothetical protein [Thermocoleostomius sinensis]|uniref:Uncharacterized protein n=1 Tax=Thermocoleostomius sinensis A174 TaxID=2016057 RepID=A0A9E8ZCA9_9CYAN|nr:hypothetical protein [Thermocoleostomius sinensis]WAL60640.1 hypothetical protein OXH18_01185 [Thermocoleostomius sinensis A174]